MARERSENRRSNILRLEVENLPNWCEGDLKIVGRKADLERFKNYANSESSCLDHNKFIPYPEKWELMDKIYNSIKDFSKEPRDILGREIHDGFNHGGHDWCRKHWGTKWGICCPELVRETSRSLFYRFETAWSPPIPIIKAMSKKFPTLRFTLKYYESGMAFKGVYIVKAGKVIKDLTGEYHGRRGG